MNHIALSRILHKFLSKALFCYLKYFWKILIRASMGWSIWSILDQSLSTLYIVWSMLNFAMILANSNQETIQTIWFDPYCLHKIFITFHQRLTLFSISNTLKKLKWRQQNLIHIVLNIIILFKRQHGLISAIVSLKRILNIFNIET